jgi:hypothetical protein
LGYNFVEQVKFIYEENMVSFRFVVNLFIDHLSCYTCCCCCNLLFGCYDIQGYYYDPDHCIVVDVFRVNSLRSCTMDLDHTGTPGYWIVDTDIFNCFPCFNQCLGFARYLHRLEWGSELVGQREGIFLDVLVVIGCVLLLSNWGKGDVGCFGNGSLVIVVEGNISFL